jgi:hypothetical protein
VHFSRFSSVPLGVLINVDESHNRAGGKANADKLGLANFVDDIFCGKTQSLLS